jgi:hypothetical protein
VVVEVKEVMVETVVVVVASDEDVCVEVEL